MCGIAGIINLKSPDVDRDTLKKMNDSLARRGPDDEGYAILPHAGLAHRRLSIIDLSTGHQPMSSADGRYTIVFNGEIYNFLEIKKELEKTGTTFLTHSDTEVLLRLYEKKHEKCLEELNGMFAFAIWDAVEHTLFLARDRVGKKPLYYAQSGDFFVFASELKALLEFPSIKRDLDPVALKHYLVYEYVPAPFSIIRNVNKLPQAHSLVLNCRTGSPKLCRYWEPSFQPPIEAPLDAAMSELHGRLLKATEYRLIADVPVGVFLSGGIDSSSVVSLMSELREGRDIRTFSINFQEKSYDESDYSLAVARHFGTDHHEETLTAQGMLEILPEVCAYMDEPFADGSILPTYLLSRFTRNQVKVALGGDGADELFAGYPTFFADRLARIYQALPQAIKKPAEFMTRFLPASEKNMSLDFKVRQFLAGVSDKGVIKNQLWLAGFAPDQLGSLLREEVTHGTSRIDVLDLVRREMEHCSSKNQNDQLLYFYQKFYMCDDILVKVDRASMANSLEVRAPYLDHHVVEYANRLPYHVKLRGRSSKFILKKIFRDRLPPQITSRSKKGFGIPIAGWFKNELRADLLNTLSKERLQRDGLFRWGFVKQLLGEHLAGKRNHRKPLFVLYMLHKWMEGWL